MRSHFLIARFVLCFCLMATTAIAQRLAILVPETADRDVAYVERLDSGLRRHVRILDIEQSTAAYRSLEFGKPYNMTATQARAAAAVMGCEYFLILRTGGLRRESFAKAEYYEAFAVTYLVNGRTGLLSGWWLKSFEAADQGKADELLSASIDASAAEIAERIKKIGAIDAHAPPATAIEEVPAEGSPAAAKLKPPIPYRRLKPEYTPTAALYDIKATIDVEADIDSDGKVLATRIVRWAGFGLDESVETAVRSMNWRPAMRDGKPLPMRILLRYNFTKLDKQ